MSERCSLIYTSLSSRRVDPRGSHGCIYAQAELLSVLVACDVVYDFMCTPSLRIVQSLRRDVRMRGVGFIE